jgi:hypothetical protein
MMPTINEPINENVAMTADVTVFTAKVNGRAEISATSGTVTVQVNINGAYSNSDTTIANGTFKVIDNIQQGTLIKVTGGNANIHFWN